MPRLLASRAEHAIECISVWQEAAERRFDDGCAMLDANNGSTAIYLWGYSAEMAIKSALFMAARFARRQPIRLNDLRSMAAFGQTAYGLAPPRNLHDLRFWSQLLVAYRAARGNPHAPPYGLEILRRTADIDGRWREFLRYRVNVAYRHETEVVGKHAEWLIRNMANL